MDSKMEMNGEDSKENEEGKNLNPESESDGSIDSLDSQAEIRRRGE